MHAHKCARINARAHMHALSAQWNEVCTQKRQNFASRLAILLPYSKILLEILEAPGTRQLFCAMWLVLWRSQVREFLGTHCPAGTSNKLLRKAPKRNPSKLFMVIFWRFYGFHGPYLPKFHGFSVKFIFVSVALQRTTTALSNQCGGRLNLWSFPTSC